MLEIYGEKLNNSMLFEIKEKSVTEDIIKLIVKKIHSNNVFNVCTVYNFIIKDIVATSNGIEITISSAEDNMEFSTNNKKSVTKELVEDFYEDFNDIIYNVLVNFLKSEKEKLQSKKKITKSDQVLLDFLNTKYRIVPEKPEIYKARVSAQIYNTLNEIDDDLVYNADFFKD